MNLGLVTFTTNLTASTQSAYTGGVRVRALQGVGPTIFLEGIISSFSGTSLTLIVDTLSGSGSQPGPWNFTLQGNQGATGASGLSGATGLGYALNSLSNVEITLASNRTFTTTFNTNLSAYFTNMRIRASATLDEDAFIDGIIQSISGTTLVIDPQLISGSGYYDDWKFSVVGLQGATGLTGATGQAITGPGYAGLTSSTTKTLSAPATLAFVTNVNTANTAYIVGDRVRVIDSGTYVY
jgi:hypothetical protein